MKKITSKLSALLLALALLLPCTMTVQAAQQKAPGLTNDQLKQTIEHVMEYAKLGDETFYNADLIADVRAEAGNWFPLSGARYGLNEDTTGILGAFTGYAADIYGQDLPEEGWNPAKPAGQLKSAVETARIIIMIASLGGDPRSVDLGGGVKADLVSDLTSNKFPLAGDSWVTTTSYRLLALDAVNAELPAAVRNELIDKILGEKKDNGAFGYEQDYDTTAMVVQALAPYYGKRADVTAAVDKALELFSSVQQADGSYAAFGTGNAETTAQILVALDALNIDTDADSRFIKDGNSVVDGLMRFYNAGDHGFSHSTPGASNPGMPTQQALYALVSHYRFQNGERRLFDLGAEPNKNLFVLVSGGTAYTIKREPGKLAYELALPAGTKTIRFQALPTGAYGTSNTALNTEVDVADGQSLTVTVMGQNAGAYTIAVRIAKDAPSSGTENGGTGTASPPTGQAGQATAVVLLLLSGCAAIALTKKKK